MADRGENQDRPPERRPDRLQSAATPQGDPVHPGRDTPVDAAARSRALRRIVLSTARHKGATDVGNRDDDATSPIRDAVEEQLEQLQEAVRRLEAERNGMADELFRAYEHLGILFEVTRRLPGARSEAEVIGLFLNSLQHSYPDSTAWVVPDATDEGGDVPWDCPYVACARDALVDRAVTRCKMERRAVVEAETNGATPVRQVMAGPVTAGGRFVCSIVLSHGTATGPTHPLQSADMQLMDSLALFCSDLISNLRLVGAMRQLSIDLVRALVSAIDQKDEYTAGHSTRVGHYACLLGRELGFSPQELTTLEWAALLHDVGKIGIHDEVLNKPGALTESEFEHIRSHPTRSANVVRQVPQLADALAGVLHHHEHYDGSGYPDGLIGAAIPLQARVIQIADVFDALTTTRPYRSAYTWDKALEILQAESGRTVDAELAAIFDRLVRLETDQDPNAVETVRERARQESRRPAHRPDQQSKERNP